MFAFCKGHTFGMVLEMPEPRFCILQGALAFIGQKRDFRAVVLILWKALHFVSPWS